MFDIGFWEIALIAVVALLVVGPEEFPALVRTIGAALGKVRRFIHDAKQELDREALHAEELKRLMEKEAQVAELHKVVEDVNATIPIDAPGGTAAATEQKERESSEAQPPQDAAPEQPIEKTHGSSKEISS
ncbi:MAG: Sec-independent protein translocase protein TatB [Gammaproteobacteria bacterium]